jgi:hypothetical protein
MSKTNKNIKCITCALIFVQKTIPPIYRNGGSIEEVYHSGAVKTASLKDDTTQVVNGQRLSIIFLEILIMKMLMLFK